MHKMKRKDALDHLRIALVKGDTKKALQLYVENNISMKVFAEYKGKYLNA